MYVRFYYISLGVKKVYEPSNKITIFKIKKNQTIFFSKKTAINSFKVHLYTARFKSIV